MAGNPKIQPVNLQDAASVGWQDKPTTSISEARAVALVTAKYGPKVGAAFKKWYDAARKKDPAITPRQATVAFLAAYSLGNGIAAVGGVVGQVPGAAAKGAEKAVQDLSPGGASPACALHVPAVGPFGGWCVISKTALRGLVGGLVLVGAGAVGIAGVVVLAAHGLDSTQAGQALKKSGATVAKVAAVAG
jgi:hypothetical protein